MTTRSVYPAADATSEIIFNRKLSSGMPSLQAATKASKLWSQMCVLVDSHGLQWLDDLALFIQTKSGLELIKS